VVGIVLFASSTLGLFVCKLYICWLSEYLIHSVQADATWQESFKVEVQRLNWPCSSIQAYFWRVYRYNQYKVAVLPSKGFEKDTGG